MKKLIALIMGLVLTSGLMFARGFYNGDIQFQLEYVPEYASTIENYNEPLESKLWGFGIESWNLFKPLGFLGLGFMAGVDGAGGKTTPWVNETYTSNQTGYTVSANCRLGPALGVYIVGLVCVEASFAFNAGITYDSPVVYKGSNITENVYKSYFAIPMGYDFEVQAKFIPNFPINPVIGWRYIKSSADSLYFVGGSLFSASKTKLSNKYTNEQNLFYAGVSFSW